MFRYILLTILYSFSLFAIENTMGTTGYLRLQTSSDDAKANTCFQAPGASTKYRLGNECETWIELAVFQDLSFDNGVVVHNQVRPIFKGNNNERVDLLRFDELYSEISNIFDNSVSFWIGRRFYKRYDSYLSDHFFFNMSGDGFGVNNLDLGEVKLSYSFIFSKIDPAVVVKDEEVLYQSHDLRFEKTIDRGITTFFFNYMHLEGKQFNATQQIQQSDGFALGVLYEDTQITDELFNMKGKNITGVFFGKGLAKGAGASSPYSDETLIEDMIANNTNPDKSKTFRFINYNGFENDTWGLMTNLVYEYKDDKALSNTEQNWYSMGVRPYWMFSKHARLLLEVGYDLVDDSILDKNHYLLKYSTALEFALKKGIWEKPVLRFFYTQADWSESSKGLVGGSYYADKTSGNNFGVQVEYWW